MGAKVIAEKPRRRCNRMRVGGRWVDAHVFSKPGVASFPYGVGLSFASMPRTRTSADVRRF